MLFLPLPLPPALYKMLFLPRVCVCVCVAQAIPPE